MAENSFVFQGALGGLIAGREERRKQNESASGVRLNNANADNALVNAAKTLEELKSYRQDSKVREAKRVTDIKKSELLGEQIGRQAQLETIDYLTQGWDEAKGSEDTIRAFMDNATQQNGGKDPFFPIFGKRAKNMSSRDITNMMEGFISKLGDNATFRREDAKAKQAQENAMAERRLANEGSANVAHIGAAATANAAHIRNQGALDVGRQNIQAQKDAVTEQRIYEAEQAALNHERGLENISARGDESVRTAKVGAGASTANARLAAATQTALQQSQIAADRTAQSRALNSTENAARDQREQQAVRQKLRIAHEKEMQQVKITAEKAIQAAVIKANKEERALGGKPFIPKNESERASWVMHRVSMLKEGQPISDTGVDLKTVIWAKDFVHNEGILAKSKVAGEIALFGGDIGQGPMWDSLTTIEDNEADPKVISSLIGDPSNREGFASLGLHPRSEEVMKSNNIKGEERFLPRNTKMHNDILAISGITPDLIKRRNESTGPIRDAMDTKIREMWYKAATSTSVRSFLQQELPSLRGLSLSNRAEWDTIISSLNLHRPWPVKYPEYFK